jgi:hypothetical protein
MKATKPAEESIPVFFTVMVYVIPALHRSPTVTENTSMKIAAAEKLREKQLV